MDHPVKDVRNVVRAIAQGTPEEQKDAVNRYFAPNASFVHPFCRVPSFEKYHIPGLGEVNSRMLFLAILKWYKILSPKIDIEVESSVFDQRASLLYVTASQTFSLWFIPFHKAPVRLVSVLHLVPADNVANGHANGNAASGRANGNGNKLTDGAYDNDEEEDEEVEVEEGPSYAAVASGDASLPDENETDVKIVPPNPALNNGNNGGAPSSPKQQQGQLERQDGDNDKGRSRSRSSKRNSPARYLIQRQVDYYQNDDQLRFLFASPSASLWYAFQLMNTLFCVVGVLFLGPIMAVLGPMITGKSSAKQRMMLTGRRGSGDQQGEKQGSIMAMM